MSNALKHINVARVANAVTRTMEQQKQHKDFKFKKALDQDVKAAKEVTSMELELAAIEILPKAEQIIGNHQSIVYRGYFVTHRHIGHLLPAKFKWCVDGVLIINAVLEKIPVTAQLMQSEEWKKLIQQHLDEVHVAWLQRTQMQEEYHEENAQVLQAVRQEIHRLFVDRNEIYHNYGELLGYLRSGMYGYFRGARGVRLIHQAMIAEIDYAAERWSAWMESDLAAAVARDTEHREARRNILNQNNRNQVAS